MPGFFDNDSMSVTSKTSRSGRTKKSKALVKRRSRSQDRERRSRRRDSSSGTYKEKGYRRSRSRSRDQSHDRSRSRSRSRRRSSGATDAVAMITDALGFGDSHDRSGSPKGGSSSFFGLGNGSRSGLFGGGGSGRSSYYKRNSRRGFVDRTAKKIKKLLNELVHYAKKHPHKVLVLVLVPLITGGALTALLARFGLRLPHTIERMIALVGRFMSGDAMGAMSDAVRMVGGNGDGVARMVRSGTNRNGDFEWERTELHRTIQEGGWAEGLKSVTKMFF